VKTRSLFFVLLGLTGLFLGGCASPAQSSAMVPTSLAPVGQHAASVDLNVTGGSATSAASASQISDADFSAALAESIRKSGLFAAVTGTGQRGDYHLEVAIVRLQRPLVGFSMTATIETNWTLTRQTDRAVIWRKAITSSHTARTGEAFAGVTRLRLATEGAARENIRDAIAQLGALQLP
jgi:hypothetical protein